MHELAATLMLVSGFTHQIPFIRNGIEKESIGSSVFGITYFLIGLGLLAGSSIAIICGAIFPTIGLLLGSYLFFFVKKDALTPLHLIIDIVVITYCALTFLPTSN
ncbi:hypothetical protein R50073_31230 [Maricurvus nonylphenolicus]|uniref:hypothetical protein n=1 Tax=Maricurvus nonylphenolicus TaxID=1008307 RepID=UPI0036F33429